MEKEPPKMLELPTSEEVDAIGKKPLGDFEQIVKYKQYVESLSDDDPKKAEVLRVIEEELASVEAAREIFVEHLNELHARLEAVAPDVEGVQEKQAA